MAAIYLHERRDFSQLLSILEEETGILAGLIEKDYWIMHSLYGLKRQGYDFQLKGGTSLSKGYGIIDRFSEDIDLHINPPAELGINENPKNNKAGNIEKKRLYYNRLAGEISIPGITSVDRDIEFDDTKTYNSGGIRLHYYKLMRSVDGLKDGILLEAGYDTVAPNAPITITSWAYERAKTAPGLELIDNRAVDILCYDPRYTFVEKLQTVATKFRREMETGQVQTNYMRQYYDLYCLLKLPQVVEFLGTAEYLIHKEKRFPAADLAIPVRENQAFLLEDREIKMRLRDRYERSRQLYYKGQPLFNELLSGIQQFIDRL